MIAFVLGLIGAAFNFALELIPGWIRAGLSNVVISLVQPILMPIVYANWFPDILTRMAIRLQLQYVPVEA